ncbi:hypothetical protein [Stenotrophomonas phage TS-10]|uniref:Uncharacterized protein n=1 Tax=Stenotrophomonas phage TS-10 TaxID=2886106 RepID=A0AAE9C3R4_9CAUD|nr:hypothetical protein [Stenotrophomonas phage TS-10]
MQFVTYKVTLVSPRGRVIPAGTVTYTDAATEKGIKQDIAHDQNVSVEAVVIREVSREAV